MFLLMGLALGLLSLVFKVGGRLCGNGIDCFPTGCDQWWAGWEHHILGVQATCRCTGWASTDGEGCTAPRSTRPPSPSRAPPTTNPTPCTPQAKLPAWGSLLLCLCGVANAKSGHADVKQFISSLTFAVFGLVSSYLMPIGRRAAEAAAEAASAGAASELPVA